MLTKLKLANPVARLKTKRSVHTIRWYLRELNSSARTTKKGPPWHRINFMCFANEMGSTLDRTERRSRPEKPIKVRQ